MRIWCFHPCVSQYFLSISGFRLPRYSHTVSLLGAEFFFHAAYSVFSFMSQDYRYAT
jgi:hypothetical protein